jgi:hypothetical protein
MALRRLTTVAKITFRIPGVIPSATSKSWGANVASAEALQKHGGER